MTEDEVKEIGRLAIDKFGIDSQMDQCVEEMAELTQAIMKRKKGVNNISNLLEEIIDVKIMIVQMLVYFSDYEDDLEDIAVYKLSRLKIMVSKGV